MQDPKIREYAERKSQLFIKRASIYSNMTINSDMLKVRLLPDMLGFDAKDLPNYACFSPSTIIRGVAEVDTNDVSKSSQVWVLCTEDYKVGWIMAEANNQYSLGAEKALDPWGFNAFKTHIERCSLDDRLAEYSELKILFNNQSFVDTYKSAGIDDSSNRKTAISLDVVNIRTGDRIMMLQSGTTFALTQDQILLRVGSPNSDVSYIKMTAGSIEISANSVGLWGKNATSLGKHGMRLCGMLGAPTATDGSPQIPLLDVTC